MVETTGVKENGGGGWRRVLWRGCKSVVLMYLMVVLVISMLQTKLIFPGAGSQGMAEARVEARAGEELVRLTTAGREKTVGLFGRALGKDGREAADWRERPTVIYFYGNGMWMAEARGEFGMMRRAGANAMLVEYLGYGMAEGSAGEAGCYAAAEAAYQHVVNRGDVDARKIVLAGWSLGGAVAIELAHRHRSEGRVIGVMTFSSFTSMADVAKALYPVFPIEWMLKHRFESLKKVKELGGVPMLIGHGRRDSMIGYGMSEKLREAARGAGSRVMELTMEEGDHNEFFVEEELVVKAVRAFLEEVL